MADSGRKKSFVERLALGIASGHTLADAARQAGVAYTTARRYAKMSAFSSRVAEIRASMIDAAIGRLTANSTAASDTLAQLLASENETVQLAAARQILTIRGQLAESVELRTRIQDLENTVEELTHESKSSDRDNEPKNRAADCSEEEECADEES